MVSTVAFLTDIIDPGLEFLRSLGGPQVTAEARRFLLAIAQQESGPQLNARYQGSPSTSPGPARGFWQFEQGGGVAGVRGHNSSKNLAAAICDRCAIQNQNQAVWRSLEAHDLLAVSFARLLVLTSPKALPKTQQEGWQQYLDLWRPGKPHPDSWPSNWSNADKAVQSVGATRQVGV